MWFLLTYVEARFWKAGLAGESRVSLRAMVRKPSHMPQTTDGHRRSSIPASAPARRGRSIGAPVVAAVTAALVALTACGGSGDSVDEARATADTALDQVEQLTERITSLERELSAASGALADAEAGDRDLGRRLDKATDRLQKSLGRLRKSVDAAGEAAESAAADSGSALAQAQAAARDLAVLRERYDYHLRRYHGGR